VLTSRDSICQSNSLRLCYHRTVVTRLFMFDFRYTHCTDRPMI
jgi:hypothetical protein